jgi:hypothetical protein
MLALAQLMLSSIKRDLRRLLGELRQLEHEIEQP